MFMHIFMHVKVVFSPLKTTFTFLKTVFSRLKTTLYIYYMYVSKTKP